MKTTTKWFTRTLLSGAIAASLAMAGVQSYASSAPEGAQPEAKTTQVQPAERARAAAPTIDRNALARYPGWKNPDLMRLAVHNGREVMGGIRIARDAIEKGDIVKAREELAAASAFSENIRYMSPYTVVVNRIENAKHETLGTTSDVVVDDMLPIYSGLDTVAAYDVEKAGQAKASNQVGQSGESSQARSDKQDQSGKSDPATASKEEVDEVGADVTASTLYLPVRYVSAHIATARRALAQEKPDLNIAKGALTEALESLVQATVDVHMVPEQGRAAAQPHVGTGSPQHQSPADHRQG